MSLKRSSNCEQNEIFHKSETGIFNEVSYDEEGVITDFNSLPTEIEVSPTPTLRIHNIHSKSQILSDPKSDVQTRSKVQQKSGAHALFSYIQKQQRNNHKDQQHYLPHGMKVIGTKWVYRNKRDERGVVVRNKARLVAQGYTQEEGIDYDEVFAPVARIEAIMLFLAFASFMGFIVYQIDLKSAFSKVYKVVKSLYGLIQALELGLQSQNKEGIFISQDKYVAEILKKFDLVSVKTAITPMETKVALTKDEEAVDVDVTLKTSHLNAVKRIFKYLKGKPNLGLWYHRESPFDLEAFFDSDYGGSNLDRKSTTGGCQFLGQRLISWQCKKQTIVATSTTEAEYVAAANCYASGITMLPNNAIFEGMGHMGYPTDGSFNFRKAFSLLSGVSWVFTEVPRPFVACYVSIVDPSAGQEASSVITSPIIMWELVIGEAVQETPNRTFRKAILPFGGIASGEEDSGFDHLVSLVQEACLLPHKTVNASGARNKSQYLLQTEVEREGKAPMTEEEETQASRKTKEQILQEEAGLAEAIRLDALEKALEKEEVAKQVHLDSLIAQRMAEEQELIEEQKKRKAQKELKDECAWKRILLWTIMRKKVTLNPTEEKLKKTRLISQPEAWKEEKKNRIARKGFNTDHDKDESEDFRMKLMKSDLLQCMTRSSTNELYTPYKDPEREFRSSKKHFKSLSLDELRSPDFNLLSDKEYSEEEEEEAMAETMEQYMSKTRTDYGSGVARPKIDNKDQFELKGQFLKELRENTFSGSDNEDANEHIEKALSQQNSFIIPCS
ncbi:putative ribonuclease H-like domain-containing protein [Tanacetum coccineum]